MTSRDDIIAALDAGIKKKKRHAFQSEEERKAAALRRARAASTAKTALTHLHPKDYRILYDEALRRLEEDARD